MVMRKEEIAERKEVNEYKKTHIPYNESLTRPTNYHLYRIDPTGLVEVHPFTLAKLQKSNK